MDIEETKAKQQRTKVAESSGANITYVGAYVQMTYMFPKGKG